MPNALAYFMVLAWPVLAMVAFRRLPPGAGIAAAILGAFLLLPSRTSIDLPFLPGFDKGVSGSLAALLLILLSRHDPRRTAEDPVLPGWLPGAVWARLCLVSALAGSLATAIVNRDSLTYGPRTLPGLTFHDGFATMLSLGIMVLPYLIARKYLASPVAQRHLLLVLVAAAALYSIPTLYEIRMSPQLNRDIYGFFPASFLQHMRGDGFRPVVFLHHGLVLSLFLSLATLAALVAAGCCPDRRPRLLGLAALLLVTLFLSKSLGALAITLVLTLVILLFPLRVQLLLAAGIAAVLLTYPALRERDAMPVDGIVQLAERIDSERAGSLQFRLEHEDALLAKAGSRAWVGWGGWGRARLYDVGGKDVSVTDGTWIILFGQGGWILYLSVFGLLCLPVLILSREGMRRKADPVATGLALILAANLVDLIPNSSLIPVTWLIAGALAGRLEWQVAHASPDAQDDPPARRPLFAPSPPAALPVAPRSPTPYSPVMAAPSAWRPRLDSGRPKRDGPLKD